MTKPIPRAVRRAVYRFGATCFVIGFAGLYVGRGIG